MTNITLYHVARTRSVRPLILYHELKSIYGQRIPELMVHSIPKEQLRAPNKAAILYELNPNAKVPVLKHGETVMFEGCAICLYFLEMFDEDHILAPENQDFRAILYQFSVYTPGNQTLSIQVFFDCLSPETGFNHFFSFDPIVAK